MLYLHLTEIIAAKNGGWGGGAFLQNIPVGTGCDIRNLKEGLIILSIFCHNLQLIQSSKATVCKHFLIFKAFSYNVFSKCTASSLTES